MAHFLTHSSTKSLVQVCYICIVMFFSPKNKKNEAYRYKSTR